MKTASVSRKKTRSPAGFPSAIEFGRDVCGDLRAAERREWLVTNGIGGFASGTVAGLLTRRYHGLLIAALEPPVKRTVLVSKVEETAEYAGCVLALGTNRWADGAVQPRGFCHIERFRLHGTTPVWTFNCVDALLEKRIWMEDGENTTYIRYDVARGRGPIRLSIKVLVNYRDYHSVTRGSDWRINVRPADAGLCVTAFDGAEAYYLLSASARVDAAHEWYRNFDLAAERERGLEDREDLLLAGVFHATIEPGVPVTLVFSTRPEPSLDGIEALQRRIRQEESLLECWANRSVKSKEKPSGVAQLVLAAGQFIVDRPAGEARGARSIIAGYPWFTDWGRDTMISLPGLTLATGRPGIARSILRAFAHFVDSGMLPNYFPQAGTPPEYNSVDAALWYVEAVRQYFADTADTSSLRECYSTLVSIVDHYQNGTRFGIHADAVDGLISAGESGLALTWMDARVGEWVVTPRAGKPIEVNALWFNALSSMASFAQALNEDGRQYKAMQERVAASFQRFWNNDLQYCFDVLDGPEGNDDTLRPNQILAVSLHETALTLDQQRAVVDECSRHLLTSYGLRTLMPGHSQYRGRCVGSAAQRDSAYHQGTAWGWLIGPFALAHHRVYGDSSRALSFIEPLIRAVQHYGLGTAGEIFDGDAPFTPRGCIAQAWTVGELLRVWEILDS
ncbi:MAG: glycogen debranching enzyme family protein [Acidobacteria bacterium]|nr:glycogen debranching enzyme family protein [Acidobacteriota bacterium]